jgi:NADPH-dependent glutamate synthase beta subunit-like oxidoreductase
LFSALVRGVSLIVAELSRMKAEDDHVVLIGGQTTAIKIAYTEFLVNTTTAKNHTSPSVGFLQITPC